MRFNIYLAGMQAVKDKVSLMRQRIGDPRQILQRAAVMILDAAKVEILQGGSPSWAPTKFPSNRHHILIDTGTLWRSLSISNPDSFYFEGNSKLMVGTNIAYAKYLQEGTRNMPGRAFLKIRASLADSIKMMVGQWFVGRSEG